MIVVDENLHDQRIMSAIAAWYSGRVVSITSLRPQSVIKDDSITTLLHRIHQPTSVTINVADFWKKVEPHQNYCFVSLLSRKNAPPKFPLSFTVSFSLPSSEPKRRAWEKSFA